MVSSVPSEQVLATKKVPPLPQNERKFHVLHQKNWTLTTAKGFFWSRFGGLFLDGQLEEHVGVSESPKEISH